VYSGQFDSAADPMALYRALVPRSEAIFCFTYLVDIIAVLAFNVVPYSRCDPVKGGNDILVHHVPVLIGGTLLGSPWFFRFPFADPRLNLLDDTRAVEVANILIRWRCWGMVSSINELFMCVQRLDLPTGAFNCRAAYTIELGWKCCVFTVNALLGVVGSVQMLSAIVLSCSTEAPTTLGTISCTAASPIACSVPLHLAFVLLMYPSMGKRAIVKLCDVLAGRITGTPPGAPAEYPRDKPCGRLHHPCEAPAGSTAGSTAGPTAGSKAAKANGDGWCVNRVVPTPVDIKAAKAA